MLQQLLFYSSPRLGSSIDETMQKQCLMGTHNGTKNVSDIFLTSRHYISPAFNRMGS